MTIAFKHRQSAHCESGVAANLLTHHGLNISEAMAFGIGGGLFFAHIPFVKLFTMPMTTFRSFPGGVIKRVTKKLGVQLRRKTFKDPDTAMEEMDRLLTKGIPVGLQSGAYWLPYFPVALRFHFNGHNLVVYGWNGEEYCISDPVFDTPVTSPPENLKKARFSKGELAPKGRMYYVEKIPDTVDFTPAILSSIKMVCNRMIKAPIPIIGVRGIRYLSKKMRSWPKDIGLKRASRYLGHVIRMQEEIGTGGAGFRFMYAAFLQESAQLFSTTSLQSISDRFTEIGDRWRAFAATGARVCKDSNTSADRYIELSNMLKDLAEEEEKAFQDLRRAVKKLH